MGAIANMTTRLTAAVASPAGTLVVGYPSGSNQASLNGSTGAQAVVSGDKYVQGTGITVAYGSTDITITNTSGRTWAVGEEAVFSFGRTDRNGSYNLVLGTTADTAKRGNA